MQYKNSEEMNMYEKFIYAKEKDLCMNTNQLINRYRKFSGFVNYAKIYRFIINYRIKKYGNGQIFNNYFYRSKQERSYLKELAKQRRRSRLGR